MTKELQNTQKSKRIYHWWLIGAAFCVLVYLLNPILAPFLTAAILAYMANPIVDKIDALQIGKWSPNRSFAAFVVLLGIILITLSLLLIIVPLLQREFVQVAQRAPVYLATLSTRLQPWLTQHFGITLDMTYLQSLLSDNWKSASGIAGKVMVNFSSSGLAFIGWMIDLLLIPVVLFYLLRDWKSVIVEIASLLPRRALHQTTIIAKEMDLVIAEFLRGQLSVMLAMSLFYTIGLSLTGLTMAIPIGLLAGLLGFIPYLGITTGIVLAVLAGLLEFSNVSQLMPIGLVFMLGQILESMFLTPKLVGDRIGLHPVAVIFALLAGGQLFGFSGVLLALPVSAAIAVLIRHAKHYYTNTDFYLKE